MAFLFSSPPVSPTVQRKTFPPRSRGFDPRHLRCRVQTSPPSLAPGLPSALTSHRLVLRLPSCRRYLLRAPATLQGAPTSGPLNWLCPLLGPLFSQKTCKTHSPPPPSLLSNVPFLGEICVRSHLTAFSRSVCRPPELDFLWDSS